MRVLVEEMSSPGELHLIEFNNNAQVEPPFFQCLSPSSWICSSGIDPNVPCGKGRARMAPYGPSRLPLLQKSEGQSAIVPFW